MSKTLKLHHVFAVHPWPPRSNLCFDFFNPVSLWLVQLYVSGTMEENHFHVRCSSHSVIVLRFFCATGISKWLVTFFSCWGRSVSLYEYTIHIPYHMVYEYTIYASLLRDTWGCLQFGAIINKPVRNISQLSISLCCIHLHSFLLGKYVDMELLSHRVGVYLVF